MVGSVVIIAGLKLTIYYHSADAGVVVAVFLAILMGSFSLVLLTPESQGTSVV